MVSRPPQRHGQGQGQGQGQGYRSRLYLIFLGVSLLVAISSIWQSSRWLHREEEQQAAEVVVNVVLDAPDSIQRAIFYNIYIPDNENRTRAIAIVKEQLETKESSRYTTMSTPVYYNVIGSNATDEIQELCGPNNCHLLQYSPQGDEGLTLQSLYDYCTEHPSTMVTYIHNKGSYHPSERNEDFRVMLTKAVFTDECQTMSSRSSGDNQCNVCGARFAPFPHFHMPGNMWTAHCSYVRTLIPPNRFAQKMEDLMVYVMETKLGKVPRPLFSQLQGEYAIGLRRYAYEHWLCSHPHITPCDVFPRHYFHGYRYLPHRTNDYWRPRLQPAPRFPMELFLMISMDRGEWFCGQTRLLEFDFLYDGLQPKNTSFIWSYYTKQFKGCETPLNMTQHLGMYRTNNNNASEE